MLRKVAVMFLFALLTASIAGAGPLHGTDPNYRGALTLLSVANASGMSAKYTTEIVFTNRSGHDVSIRIEFYSTNGYREGVLVNHFASGWGTSGSFWGGSQPNWEYTNTLGTEGIGAVRIVAVKEDGTDDPTAVLTGYGRLWIEPYAGGRMSEYVPGLTDYQVSGSHRRAVSNLDYSVFMINPQPFARDLHDTTYGGARVNVAFVNFDRDHDATFTIPERNEKDFWGNTAHGDAISVNVPAGSMRQVQLPLMYYVGSNTPPIFPYATPLERQIFTVVSSNPLAPWATYASLIDGTTSASTIFLDAATDTR